MRGHRLLPLVGPLLAFASVAIVGAAVDWPCPLGRTTLVQGLAIVLHPRTGAIGYAGYLLYAIVVAPAVGGWHAHVLGPLHRWLATAAATFGDLSAPGRSIGIVHWLADVPRLAARHDGAAPALHESFRSLFDAGWNADGSIGGVLGLGLLGFAALFVARSLRGSLAGSLFRRPRCVPAP